MSRTQRLLAGAAVAALLVACAVPGPLRFERGAGAGAVIQAMGPPSAEHPSAFGGRRLEYAGGAYGRRTWMFDFDPADQLVNTEQVWTEAHFNAIKAGMTSDEVLTRIGTPSTTWPIARQHQVVWSYRYETPFCQWFMVGMGPDQHVVDTAYGPDPMCDRDRDFRIGGMHHHR